MRVTLFAALAAGPCADGYLPRALDRLVSIQLTHGPIRVAPYPPTGLGRCTPCAFRAWTMDLETEIQGQPLI